MTPRRFSVNAGNVSSPRDFEHHLVGLHGIAVHPAETLETHHGMVAVFYRPGIDVHVLRLLLADLRDTLIDVLFGDIGIAVGDFDAAVVAQFDLRDHLELRLEAQRLAVVEMDIHYIGCADHVEVLGFELLAAGIWG